MSKKYLVLTICTGEKYKDMAAVSHPRMKDYADKIDADFMCISSYTTSSPHWEKFQIYDLLAKYERIVFIDTDILIRKDAPNLLEVVPKDCFGAFNEAPFTINRQGAMVEICKAYNTTLPDYDGKYHNTGLMVISRCHRDIFKKPELEFCHFYEQSYLNLALQKAKCKMFDLSYKFNRMTCMDACTGEERYASYFIHYAGIPNSAYTVNLMNEDVVKLDAAHPDYKYQRHILIDVQGGLGDQVDCEPAIRFMKNYIYPGDDIVVKTHFPRLYQHLGLPVYLHEDFKRTSDIPYFHVISLPGPETVQWAIVSNLLCHTVDYCAMSLLHRTLPTDHKNIKIDVGQEDIDEVKKLLPDVDFKKLIIVHAGRHWESKTFPKQWWQDVVDGLHKAGMQVCLFGKDEDTRGVWDIEAREGMYDVRNLLSLGGLIALISLSGLVLSNDSAPIHIAGAFDNKIVLIPSCKHPDHILPFRGTDRAYKQMSLYKKLTLDDCGQAPTEVHGASGEFIKDKWEQYLPEPQEVIDRVIEFSKKS